MKLGEMLVRDGRLTQETLDQVIAQQTSEGGRIGSLLVARQLISPETLTVYLGLELGIPIASGATFERCKPTAVRLLSAEQAGRFRCIPIVIQGQTLIVAITDPHDMQVLDEIASETGYRIIPRVAPEIRIHFYLELYYGIPQPASFTGLPNVQGSTDAGSEDISLPAPPLPGLPPEVANPIAAPTPAPPIRSTAAPSPPKAEAEGSTKAVADPIPDVGLDSGEYESIQLDAADLVIELDDDDNLIPDQAQQRNATPVAKSSEGHTGKPNPISLQAAIDIVSKTQRRGDIADALLAHAASIFDLATLLLVRDDLAFGWKGFGPAIDNERIETLLIPLERPSMLQHALQSDDKQFRGKPFPSTLHSHWFRVLRSKAPEVAVVVVCGIGKRTVNLLYGHKDDGSDIRDEQMSDLKTLMQAASAAYVRLISRSKKE